MTNNTPVFRSRKNCFPQFITHSGEMEILDDRQYLLNLRMAKLRELYLGMETPENCIAINRILNANIQLYQILLHLKDTLYGSFHQNVPARLEAYVYPEEDMEGFEVLIRPPGEGDQVRQAVNAFRNTFMTSHPAAWGWLTINRDYT